MSGLGFNKVAGAVLATGLAILGLREVSSIVYHQDAPERPGYRIEAAEAAAAGGGGAEAADTPPDWGTVLAAANTTGGAALSRRCASCHTFDQGGANGIGPNLWNIVNFTVAGHAGYDYSPAMRAHAGEAPQWTYDELYAFLRAPSRHVPGTKMTFVGLRDSEDRINLIAYLRTLAVSQAAIPAPDPARQAGAAGAGASAAVPSAAAPAAGAAANTEQNPAGEGTSAQGAPPQVGAAPPTPPGGGTGNQTARSGAAVAPATVENSNPGGDTGRR